MVTASIAGELKPVVQRSRTDRDESLAGHDTDRILLSTATVNAIMTCGEPQIADREQLSATPAHRVALDCLSAGIAAADPARLTRTAVSRSGTTLTIDETPIDLTEYADVRVLGGGNAAGIVASEIESVLGEHGSGGVIVTDNPVKTDRIDVLRGDHPVPSERNVEHTCHLLSAARAADEDTLVIGIITGGASALLAAPAAGIALSDLQSATESLLASGASIDEINAVRKHLSAVKGGRLAAATQPATVRCLVVSDVVGNDLSTIASGPFVGDTTTVADALDVLERYNCVVPEPVNERLRRGLGADESIETPVPGDSVFDGVTTTIIGDNMVALRAAAECGADAGFEPLILSARIRGEAREAAKTQVAIAEQMRATGHPLEPPALIVSGGETTVTVHGEGVGGPNQEFVLSAAIELGERIDKNGEHAAVGERDMGDGDAAVDESDIVGADPVVVAGVDTDGIDGPTDAAGGIVDTATLGSAGISLAEARRALADNDAYTLLADANALIHTGSTGTNVNDLRVIVVHGETGHEAADSDGVDRRSE